MKKVFTSILVALIATTAIFAQQSPFTKKTNVLNLSISLPEHFNDLLLPPITLSYERCIVDNLFDAKSSIGVGGFIDNYSYFYKDVNGKRVINNLFSFGPRAAFHYAFIPQLDTYAGTMLGYVFHESDNFNHFYWNAFVGARYYFSNKWAFMSEIGARNAGFGFSLGIAYRF